MTLRTLATACLVAAGAVSARAQVIHVFDLVTLQPIEGVSITHAASGAIAITDVRGRAELTAFAEADSITLRRLGYRSSARSMAEIKSAGYRIGIEAIPLSLGEFVVSANRWEQDPARVPDQITLMSKRDAAYINPGTAADLLQQSGEVFVQRSQLGGGSPMLRGFAANRVLIVVDGVRMNNAIYRAGNLQNVISVDAQALERAEVVHGPGAMTYGSDAIGGVMDFHLLRPRFSSEDDLDVSGGAAARYGTAANEYGGHVHLGLGLRKVALLGSASFTRFGDLRMGSNGPKDYQRPWYAQTFNGVDSMVVNSDPNVQVGSSYDNINLMGKLAYKPVDELELGLNYYYSTTSDVPRYDRLIEVRPNGLPRSAEWY